MKTVNYRRALKACLLLLILVPLAGCSSDDWLWILHPNGPIAQSSVYYLIVDILLLAVVIIPATALVIWAFFRYRQGGRGRYDPTFNHSWLVEIVVWGVPLMVVGVMSYFSYQGIRAVEPYHPTSVQQAVDTSGHQQKPLKIDVITTDWQWLFVYPEQGIAVANRLIVPTKRKVEMRLTSAGVTNDFYVLKVINQIYIMPGMRTKHNFYLDRTGDYRGFSTEFSGPGFSWMNYKMKAVTPQAFDQWVAKAKASPHQMTWSKFKQFAKPTVNTGNTWRLYGQVDPNLFTKVIKGVKSGEIADVKPIFMTEDMQSEEFKAHATGTPNRGNN
ncbi:ubiquinol oxidase subunit II [Salinisphaera hydrothermalis]|uniref:Cytochrome c oxidase subunit II n=1 Tax=Salinisphaera hydrothermalis (strain C41B8) TaxID=1304275 RepID=A0A084IGG0_SALHC|nr:ubiquinol oxidase subunit II [Salinisphaera hydrothermalis]KEZ75794.1 cytochrome c oxidase subunit II [Salinisphaera hydrothermalis C41B8]